jgi:hypothetical protein
MGRITGRITSERFKKHHDVLSLKFVIVVAVIYVVLCHMPLIGTGLPKLHLLPGAEASTIVDGPVLLTNFQCKLLRDDFVEMFMEHDTGEIEDCHSAVVALVWDQIIVRQYGINSFEDLRPNANATTGNATTWVISDASISKLLMRAALGSYVDTTDPTRSFAKIRADAYAGRVVRIPASSEVKVTILEVALVAALLAVWQGWWIQG